ncbi:MAG: hypothetical protein ACRD1Y_07995, partial [Terriglobales bacterium]
MRRFSGVAAGLMLALVCLLAGGCRTADRPGLPQASTAAVAETYQLAATQLAQADGRFEPALANAVPPRQRTQSWKEMEAKY